MKLPEKGEKMFVRGSMSISSGSSDTAGGLATIKEVQISSYLNIDHINSIMVEFEELPGHGFNYKILLKEQAELAKLFCNGEIAHPDPDIDTPWIQKGDFVNGKIYEGSPIW